MRHTSCFLYTKICRYTFGDKPSMSKQKKLYIETAFHNIMQFETTKLYPKTYAFDAIMYSICRSSFFYVTSVCFDAQIIHATRKRYRCDTNHRIVSQSTYTSAERWHVKTVWFRFLLNAKNGRIRQVILSKARTQRELLCARHVRRRVRTEIEHRTGWW